MSGSPIDSFLISIKKGSHLARFYPSESFLKQFSNDVFLGDKRNWEFTTHTQLDDFASTLKEMCKDVEKIYFEEWALLKSFDRGFWLKFYGEDSKKLSLQSGTRIEHFSPSKKESKHKFNCPFGDPKLTGSFR